MRTPTRGELLSIAVVLVAGGLTVGCGKKDQAKATPEVSVVTLQPERVAITFELPGRTSAFLMAEVHPQVNGIVQKRLFTEGSDVKEGELLYQIDPRPYQA
ncbi:MAG TPA: biotin/lipoyl-binding protein, partial [Geothrix sp.]|nr:biotin/lipoyl-binding protein [Geothrix sp.]